MTTNTIKPETCTVHFYFEGNVTLIGWSLSAPKTQKDNPHGCTITRAEYELPLFYHVGHEDDGSIQIYDLDGECCNLFESSLFSYEPVIVPPHSSKHASNFIQLKKVRDLP